MALEIPLSPPDRIVLELACCIKTHGLNARRMTDKDGKVQERWMMRDVANLVKKNKEAYVRFMKLKLVGNFAEYERNCRELK